MRKQIWPVILSLFLSFSAQASQNETDPQSAMEEALKGFTSIQQLVRNSAALNQYYHAVNEYYQQKIPRDKFDLIMNQLLVLSGQDEDFNRRAFSKQDSLPDYEIRSDVKTYGRSLNFQIWTKVEENIFLPKPQTPASLDGLMSKLKAVADQIAQFESEVSGVGKKQAGQLRASFYLKLKNENDFLFKKIVSHIYHYDTDIQYLASQNDADFILYIFESALKEKIKELSVPENLKSLISTSLPKTAELLLNKDLFPIALSKNKNDNLVPAEPMQSVTYRFTPFKKRIHAVWKGIWIKECVAGGDERPTPRRWATALLDSVYNYAVEKNKGFVGFIQELGMRRKGSQSTYYSIEFGVPNLKESIMVMGDRKIPQKVNMLEKWMQAAPKSHVYIKGRNDSAIDNAGVLSTLRNLNYWNFRKEVGTTADYQLLDQGFADLIVDLSVKNDFEPNYKYGDAIISDATLGSSGTLAAVVHVEWTKSTLEKYLRKKIKNSQELISLVSTNTALVDQLDFDSIFEEIYERLAFSSTEMFVDLLNAARARISTKAKYISMLLSEPRLDTFSKTVVLIKTSGSTAAVDFVKLVKLDANFIDKIMSKDHISGQFIKTVHQAVVERILKEQLANFYQNLINKPFVTENAGYRSDVIKAILNVSPSERTILSALFSDKDFYQIYSRAQESYRLRLYELAKNSGLSEIVRRNAILNGGLNVFNNTHGELHINSNSAILKDIIEQNNENLLTNFFSNNNKDQYFDFRQLPEFVALVNLVLQSQKDNLIALLDSVSIKSVYARIKDPQQELSGASIEHYKKLMRPQQFEQKKPISALGLFKQGSQLSYQEVVNAKMQKLTPADRLMLEVLKTNQPEKLHQLQTQLSILLVQQELSQSVTSEIKYFLLQQKNNENWKNSKYQILVLFEISAKFVEISDDIHELLKNLADKVLTEPEFQKYAVTYKPLFEARSQRATKCLGLFL